MFILYAYLLVQTVAIVVWDCDVPGAETERTSQRGEIAIQAAVLFAAIGDFLLLPPPVCWSQRRGTLIDCWNRLDVPALFGAFLRIWRRERTKEAGTPDGDCSLSRFSGGELPETVYFVHDAF